MQNAKSAKNKFNKFYVLKMCLVELDELYPNISLIWLEDTGLGRYNGSKYLCYKNFWKYFLENFFPLTSPFFVIFFLNIFTRRSDCEYLPI